MPGRTLLLIAILVLAVAVPILVSEDGLRSKPVEPAEAEDAYRTIDDSFQMVSVEKEEPPAKREPFWKSWFGTKVVEKEQPPERSLDLPLAPTPEGRTVTKTFNGPPGATLGDVLRFDITPNWLSQNWTRVTTELTDPELHGIRVPFSSGTETHDFTGSLSYYFNRQNAVERITMYGFTGDFEPLAALLGQRFGFRRYASVGPGLYMFYREDVPLGVMRVENAPVQTRDNAARNYRIRLEMNLPRDGATLSEAMLSELRRLREANLL